MFQRPWKIWLLFGLCLALILPAMIWMTIKAMQLEESRHQVMAQNENARREAELQELVSVALWRMDWMLTPLVGQEATRSHLDYQTLAFAPSKGFDPFDPETWNDNVSPIVNQPSKFVMLHFEVNESDRWFSPQNPTGQLAEAAIANGIPVSQINLNSWRMDELANSFSNRDLVKLLPAQLLPDAYEMIAQSGRGSAFPQPADLLDDGPQQQMMAAMRQQGAYYVPNNLEEQIQILNNEQSENSQQRAEQFEPQDDSFGPQGNATPRNATPQTPNQQARVQRNSAEFLQRANVGQQLTQNYSVKARREQPAATDDLVREGVSRPVWLNGKLLLARRTIRNDETWLQGCWFDWEQIQTALKKQIQDLLPGAELVPYEGQTGAAVAASGRVLATLPIELDVSNVRLASYSGNASSVTQQSRFSPIRVSLIVAWSCLLLGTIAVATLLQGVVTLSERRASFVSAVTHELRTPLTTFRMYAEMLAKRMVRSPEQQQQYCETLQVEADRLSHLVENVLQFARLEHGGKVSSTERVQPGEMLERIQMRLQERVEQAGMNLEIEFDKATAETDFRSDPAAIEHVLFNLIDNACKYASSGADKSIVLQVTATPDRVEFRVRDNGPGIAPGQAKRIFRPFSKSAEAAADSAPGIGLGLALCQQLSRQLNGRLTMESSSPESGTVFLLSLPRSAAS